MSTMTPEQVAEGLRRLCAEVDFDLSLAHPMLIARMQLLAETGEVCADARRMTRYAHRVFDHVERAGRGKPFSAMERQTVVLGCLFSDLGKSGPLGASPDEQRVVAELFAVEGVKDDRTPVAELLAATFDDAARRVEVLRRIGVDPQMTMRSFWNLHSGWTLAIAEEASLPREAVGAAASHHVLDDVNPERIVSDSQRFTRDFGQNTHFDRIEKLIILLDKYDAVRRRSGQSHAEAIAWLTRRLDHSLRYGADEELRALLVEIDEALAPMP